MTLPENSPRSWDKFKGSLKRISQTRLHPHWRLTLAALAVFSAALAVPEKALCAESGVIQLKDHRGQSVSIPETITRVAVIDDGMVEQVMTRFGVAEKIIATGSECIPKTWNPAYPGAGGETYAYRGGMHTVTCLNPRLMEVPLIAKYGCPINYERLAALKPDLLIARIGSCPLCAGRDVVDKSLALVESLGIPVVALCAPDSGKLPDISAMYREIRLLGEVFGKEKAASELINYLEKPIALIRARTGQIPDAGKKRLLLLGLSPRARRNGAAGNVKGNNTIQSYFLTGIVNAKNAYDRPGAWPVLSAEQILALDPDAVVLITAWGYHPPRELYEAPYYRNLGALRAVKNRRVAALPFTPCNCEKRLEFPIDIMVMAKTAYPLVFEDIDLGPWIRDFYRGLYKVDAETAARLMACQWMTWALPMQGPGFPSASGRHHPPQAGSPCP